MYWLEDLPQLEAAHIVLLFLVTTLALSPILGHAGVYFSCSTAVNVEGSNMIKN